jgi:CubicO group peptidase (beta-lactamase class C family)
MERSMGWRPFESPDDAEGTYAYLRTLGKEGPHGGQFTYRSADTDMLGWVCERAAGARIADLVSTLVWQPIGAERPAEITCDRVGTAVHDGGMSATARDMARFGQMLLEGGTVDGVEVVPSRWLEESFHPGDDVRDAFAASDNEPVLPGGWYRNQLWFVPGGDSVAMVCLGIHGQMVYVRPASRLVAVKQSSWPTPQDVHHLVDTLRAFRAVGEVLSPPPGASAHFT